jgi:predicted enzyme related to lactoylglutathione lyase
MTNPTPGSIVQVEMTSADLSATWKFLEGVFGWKFKKEDMPAEAGMEYWTFDAGSGPRGGITNSMGGVPPSTLHYVLVESVDAALKKIVAHGGKIRVPKDEIPKVGWFAVYEIPGGVVQAIFQPNRKP